MMKPTRGYGSPGCHPTFASRLSDDKVARCPGGGAMVTDEPAGEADQDWRKGRQPWPLRDVPDGRGRRVAAHVQGHPDAYCLASRAARTSVRGAVIECDKQRWQGCAMTKANQQFYARRGGNPSIPLPTTPIAVRAFCFLPMDPQKPDNGARLSRNPRKNFFLSVNYLTLLDRFLNDAA